MKEDAKHVRLLLIARHFPPHISGGARRPYGLALALQYMGHEVFVVAPDLPDNIEGLVVPHPNASPEPGNGPVRKTPIRDFARETFLLPDPDIRWTHRAVKAIKEENLPTPDWLITTSPPESLHVAGSLLKTYFGCKWLADFRDLWLENPLRESRQKALRQIRERRIARSILKHVDAVTAVDPFIQKEIANFTPHTPPTAVIPNFAIPSQLLPRTKTVSLPADKRNIVYTGSFSLSDPKRTIEPALNAFAATCRQNDALHIAGRMTREEEAFISQISEHVDVRYHGVLPLDAAMALQEAADILMLYAAPEALAPSGKFHEYCGLNTPILVIGDGPWRSVIDQMDNPPVTMTALHETVDAVRDHKKAKPLGFAQKFLNVMGE